jgi:hypothetical protein
MKLIHVIAREHFMDVAGFKDIGATEAIPMRLRGEIDFCAHDQGDCRGLPFFRTSFDGKTFLFTAIPTERSASQ